MFITKKHIQRRALLRRRRRRAGTAVARCDVSRRDRAGADRRDAAAAFLRRASCRTARRRATGFREGRRVARRAAVHLEAAGAVPRTTRDPDRAPFTSSEPPPGETGADHWVAAAFLCADKPKKTAGADVRAGTDDRPDHRAEDRPETCCRPWKCRSRIRAPARATAARATAACTRTRSPGRRRRRRCRWS